MTSGFLGMLKKIVLIPAILFGVAGISGFVVASELMTKRWLQHEHTQEKMHEQLGAYADLKRKPSGPAYLSGSATDYAFGAAIRYTTAKHDFDGFGRVQDVGEGYFSDFPILVGSAMAASTLVARGYAGHKNDWVPNPDGSYGPINSRGGAFTSDAYLGYLAADRINFQSERRRIDLDLSLTKFFFQHRLGIGIFVPLVQAHNILNLSLDDSIEEFTKNHGSIDSLSAEVLRYGGKDELLQDFFKAKGYTSFGGKSTGIGDVQIYGQVYFNAKPLDQAMVGARVVLPTSPYAATDALWGPERGNGGFAQAGLFFRAAGHHNRFFNPHIFSEILYCLPSYVNKHVPKRVVITQGMTQQDLDDAGVALGHRLDPIAKTGLNPGALVYQGFDGIYQMGNGVTRIKTAKGLAYSLRAGNIFEQVFFRRSFLDLFYQLTLSARNNVYEPAAPDYNMTAYILNTNVVEHRVGGEWRWQVDQVLNLTLGLEQVLWGKNTRQDSRVYAGLSYGF